MPQRPTTSLLILAGLLLLTVWRYQGTRTADFVYEDWNGANYLSQAKAEDFENDFPSISQILRSTHPFAIRTRALTRLSHRIDGILFGVNAGRFHQTNLAIHLINGGLVAGLLTVLGVSSAVWLLAVGLFLLHPLQSETVMYVSARPDLLMGMFLLVAAIGVCRLHRWWGWGLAVGGYLLAILSKEIAVMGLPALILIYQYYCNRVEYQPVLPKKVVWGLLGICAIPCVAIVYSTLRYEYFPLHVRDIMPMGIPFIYYVQLQAVSFGQDLLMLVIPIWQTVDHDPEIFPGWWQVLATAGLIDLWVVLGFRWVILGKRSLVDLGLLFGLILLAPRFVMRIGETLTEHHLYLAMLGFSLMLASIVVSFLERHWPEPGPALDFDLDIY